MLGGRQIFESSRSRDIRVALALLQKRKAEVTEGRIIISPSNAPLLSEILHNYIEQVENPNTKKRYRLSADTLLEHLGDRPITELTPFMFDKFKDDRLKAGAPPSIVRSSAA